MSSPRFTLAVLALVLVFAPPGLAQDKDKICRDVQHRPMTVGQWATYAWTGGRSNGGTMRFAIVGTEAQEGTTLEMEVVGWEDVTVPAGTFHALHIRNPREPTEAWVRPELYFGMVKVVMKDGSVLALAAHGGGAKSSITETPRPMMGPRR